MELENTRLGKSNKNLWDRLRTVISEFAVLVGSTEGGSWSLIR